MKTSHGKLYPKIVCESRTYYFSVTESLSLKTLKSLYRALDYQTSSISFTPESRCQCTGQHTV